MWFAYTNDFANWHMLKIEQVNEIIADAKKSGELEAMAKKWLGRGLGELPL